MSPTYFGRHAAFGCTKIKTGVLKLFEPCQKSLPIFSPCQKKHKIFFFFEKYHYRFIFNENFATVCSDVFENLVVIFFFKSHYSSSNFFLKKKTTNLKNISRQKISKLNIGKRPSIISTRTSLLSRGGFIKFGSLTCWIFFFFPIIPPEMAPNKVGIRKIIALSLCPNPFIPICCHSENTYGSHEIFYRICMI